MKKPRKMKLVEEVVEILEREGRTANQETVSSWVMSQMRTNPYNESRYGGLKQGDLSLYFQEYYGKES